MTSYSTAYGAYGGDERERVPRDLPFWVAGDNIIRQVIQTDLPRYLGNNAYCRPGKSQGVDGYYYSAYRPLTDAQIQSLKVDSARWNSEREVMSSRYPGRDLPGYERSATFRDSVGRSQRGESSTEQSAYGAYPPPGPSSTYPLQYPPPGQGKPSAYGSYPPAAPALGGAPAPTAGTRRYEYMPPPDNRPWYDNELKQYVPPFHPPQDSRPQQEQPTGATEDTEYTHHRQEPNAGQDSTGYYPRADYYSRN